MTNKEIMNILTDIVSPQRLENFHKVLNNRTRYITVVLEDIFQSHNASAVMRSCDCSGIQDMHLIENKYNYAENPYVALGSAQWVNRIHYNTEDNNTVSTLNKLRFKGYRIVATSPHTNDTELPDLDLSKGKIALLFGSERPGLSKIALENADEYLRIPMFGFTESYNISVSAAICLYDIMARLRKSDVDWHLNDDDREEILIQWLKVSVKDSENILRIIEERASSAL
jgi:tRNA (guanosine-2'-O-)-methyltransferase